MLPFILSLMALLVVATTAPMHSQQTTHKPPTCEQLRQYRGQGITVQQMIDGAKNMGIPEDQVRDYLKKCHIQ